MSKDYASSIGDFIIWLGERKNDASWIQTGQKIKTIHDDLVNDVSNLIKIQKLINSYLKKSDSPMPRSPIPQPLKPNLPSLPNQPGNQSPKIISKIIINNQQIEKETEKGKSIGSLPIIVTILNADPNSGHKLNAFIIKGDKFIQSKPLNFTKIENTQIANAILTMPREELSIGGDFVVCVTQNSALVI